MRKFGLLLLMVVLVLPQLGCGGGSGDPVVPENPSETPDDIEISDESMPAPGA